MQRSVLAVGATGAVGCTSRPCVSSLPWRREGHAAVCRAAAQDKAVNADAVIRNEKQYVLQTYARPDVVFTSGAGSTLTDTNGKEYLDFAAGIAVNALGHGDQRWLEAVVEQAERLTHISNLYHSVPQTELAKRLVEASFGDKVFFCNSGTEANEAAIKFARKFAKVRAGIDPYDASLSGAHEIVSFTNSFHGRTMGALALTYKEQYKTPFQPVMPGAVMAPFGDLEAAAKLIEKGRTAAVFIEPVQGEGGIHPAGQAFLSGLRKLCDDAGALLVYDEVQVGLGRTGLLWGHEHYGVEPDIMTLAKPLAGGLPIGAVVMKQHVADAMSPGDHGSTFAGNPLVCHAACAVFDVINEPSFLNDVTIKGEALRNGLRTVTAENPHVKEIRGVGLICGVQLDGPAGPLVNAARDRGLLIITAGAGDVVRMVPPLTVSMEEIERCIEIFATVLNETPL